MTVCKERFLCVLVDNLNTICADGSNPDTYTIIGGFIEIQIKFNRNGSPFSSNILFFNALFKTIFTARWHNTNTPAAQIFWLSWFCFPAYYHRLFCTVPCSQAALCTVRLTQMTVTLHLTFRIDKGRYADRMHITGFCLWKHPMIKCQYPLFCQFARPTTNVIHGTPMEKLTQGSRRCSIYFYALNTFLCCRSKLVWA